jgi:hypothetical protein
MEGVSMENGDFNDRVREILMRALVASGIVDDPSQRKWRDMSAEQLARILADAHLNPADFSDPVVANAIRLANQIAHGDDHAAKELVGASLVADGSNFISDEELAASAEDMRGALLHALHAVGMISDPADPKWQSLSVEDVAAMLASCTAKPSDPFVAAAIRLAKRMQKGDVNAKRELLGLAKANRSLWQRPKYKYVIPKDGRTPLYDHQRLKLDKKYGGSEAKRLASKVAKFGSEKAWLDHCGAKARAAQKVKNKQDRIATYGSAENWKKQKLAVLYGGSEKKRLAAKIAKYGSEEAWRAHDEAKRSKKLKDARKQVL